MNGDREDSIKPVSPDPRQMTAEGVASPTVPLKRNLAVTLPSYLIQVCISIRVHAPIRVYKFIFRPYESTEKVMEEDTCGYTISYVGNLAIDSGRIRDFLIILVNYTLLS